jgi:hypothetical protein
MFLLMKKFFSLLIIVWMSVFTGSAQVLIVDWDEVWPAQDVTAWGNIFNEFWRYSDGIVRDPDNQSNYVAWVSYTKRDPAEGGIIFKTPTFSSADFYGIAVKMKSNQLNNFRFVFTLEKSAGGQAGNWTSFPAYTGNGAWQTVVFPFIGSQTDYEFDKFSINPTTTITDPDTPLPTFDFYIDDVMLITEDITSIPSVQAGNEKKILYGNGVLTIDDIEEKAKIAIYTVAGILAYETEQDGRYSVDLRKLGIPSGLLVVKVCDGTGQFTKKIVLN